LKAEQEETEANYVQDDFFDGLSSSINRREAPKNMYRGKKVSEETFGHIPKN
jgi:hypothetical protein